VAISDSRLLDFEDGIVRFRYKDYAHGNRKRVMSLSASEFVRRFLVHVLPAGFVRIRHYGILSNRHRHEDLALCRELLGSGATTEPGPEETVKLPEGPESITPTRICPHYGAGRMIVIAEFPRWRPEPRSPWGPRSARGWTARKRREGSVSRGPRGDRRGGRVGESWCRGGGSRARGAQWRRREQRGTRLGAERRQVTSPLMGVGEAGGRRWGCQGRLKYQRVNAHREAAQFNGIVSGRPASAWEKAIARTGPPDTTFFNSDP
jgi:hypothetical protein